MSGLCGVCKRQKFRYTCPRCETLYCSLECYHGHSASCVDSFYKDQVQGELKSQRIDDKERRKLEQVMYHLAHLDAGDEDGEADGDDEDERLQTLMAKALQGQLSIEDLTEEEANRFHSELKRGALARSLDVWEPWWERAAVIDLDSLDDKLCCTHGIGEPPAHLCCSEGGTGTQARTANPAVAVTVLEVLYGYVHVMRAFNGDWSWDPTQAAIHLLHLAPAVCSHRLPENSRACLQESLVAAAALPTGGFGTSLDEHCVLDVVQVLLQGSLTTVRALREAAGLLECAEADDGGETVGHKRADRNRLRRAVKKLEFLSSFAYYHDDALRTLSAEARSFADSRLSANQASTDAQSRRSGGGIALPSRGVDAEQPKLKQLKVP